MFRVVKISALALLLSVIAASQTSAATILDPIVRTKAGPGGSIPITTLAFRLRLRDFPTPNPDCSRLDCFIGP